MMKLVKMKMVLLVAEEPLGMMTSSDFELDVDHSLGGVLNPFPMILSYNRTFFERMPREQEHLHIKCEIITY